MSNNDKRTSPDSKLKHASWKPERGLMRSSVVEKGRTSGCFNDSKSNRRARATRARIAMSTTRGDGGGNTVDEDVSKESMIREATRVSSTVEGQEAEAEAGANGASSGLEQSGEHEDDRQRSARRKEASCTTTTTTVGNEVGMAVVVGGNGESKDTGARELDGAGVSVDKVRRAQRRSRRLRWFSDTGVYGCICVWPNRFSTMSTRHPATKSAP